MENRYKGKEMLDSCKLHTETLNAVVEDVKDVTKFVTKATVVIENINDNITELVNKDDKKQDTIIAMLSDNKHMLERLNEHGNMIHKLSETQQQGCPSLANAIEARKLETDASKQAIHSLEEDCIARKDEVQFNAKQTEVLAERIKVANNRINDLEGYRDRNERWKFSIYATLATKSLAIISTLIYIIYKGLK